MNPITHGLVGWCVAETIPTIGKRERALIVAAAVAPDLDGLGLPVELVTRNSTQPLLWWSEYHHVVGHNLVFALVLGCVAALVAKVRRSVVGTAACVAAHLHLLGDLVGSRGPDGYDWPIPYWHPFSRAEYSWQGQWALNAWPNFAITLVLLAAMFALAYRRGYSPLEFVSRQADSAFVGTLRRRFRGDA